MDAWVRPTQDSDRIESIAHDLGVDRIVAALIAQRTEDHRAWTDHSFVNTPNPFLLPDIPNLISMLDAHSTIGIISDYDVDGVTSAVMWRDFLTHAGKKVYIHIPDRSAGYGASKEGVDYLTECGAGCLLCLDCGTDQWEVFAEAQIPVAIVDHHIVKTQPNNLGATEHIKQSNLDSAFIHVHPSNASGTSDCLSSTTKSARCKFGNDSVVAFVNPYRPDLDQKTMEQFSSLCTAGLSFLLIAATTHKLGIKYQYKHLLDLAALGTVADMMLLSGFNRTLVKRGLELINQSPRPTIAGLLGRLGQQRTTARDLAFFVAPKINAAGRLEHANKALALFDRDIDQLTLAQRVHEINEINLRRRTQERTAFAEAIKAIDDGDEYTYNKNVVVSYNPDCNIGIIGILAGRLKEKYAKPAFVFAKNTNNIKGSARSTKDIDLGYYIRQAISAGALESGGGHKAAGGMVIRDANQLSKFIEFAATIPECTKDAEYVDAAVSLRTLSNLRSLELLEPFGHGNPAPRFWVSCATVVSIHLIKDIHAEVTLRDSSGSQLSVLAFNVDFSTIIKDALVDVIIAYKSSNKHGCEYILAKSRAAQTNT